MGKTGTTNSSMEVKMAGRTPSSDKAGKMMDREAVKGGIRKGNYGMAEKEPKSPGTKSVMDKPSFRGGFNKGSKGK